MKARCNSQLRAARRVLPLQLTPFPPELRTWPDQGQSAGETVKSFYVRSANTTNGLTVVDPSSASKARYVN